MSRDVRLRAGAAPIRQNLVTSGGDRKGETRWRSSRVAHHVGGVSKRRSPKGICQDRHDRAMRICRFSLASAVLILGGDADIDAGGAHFGGDLQL